MANFKGAKIDKTCLSIDHSMERGFLHRDYIAHCFRWSHVIKHLHKQAKYKYAKVLDIGCGVDVPLARTMYSSKMTNTDGGLYIGLDVNKLETPPMLLNKKFNIELHGNTDLALWNTEHKFDFVCCFEVLEHVEPEHMVRMLEKIKTLLKPDGVFIMSTPCYDAHTGAADNHVNEITYKTLGSLLEHMGFNTTKRYGTFASQADYKHKIVQEGLGKCYDKLSEYYDSNVLATIFAPMYPDLARNCLWELTLGKSEHFQPIQLHVYAKQTLGSSSRLEWSKAFKLIGVDYETN